MSDVRTILQHIESKVGKRSFTLLYSPTDKISAKDFHYNCDAKGPTVTILYGKHNTIFGGYTCQDWSSPDTNETKRDNQAFLFCKNDHRGAECVFMPVKQNYKAITCNKKYGPTFGQKSFSMVYDLQTFKEETDRAGSVIEDGIIQLNGKMNIGNSYNVEVLTNSKKTSPDDHGEPKSKSSVTSSSIKKQDINSGSLTLRRMEVYQVVDEHMFDPWRKTPTEEETEKMKRHLERLKPIPGLGIKQYNILLVGAVASGKSSFYNTLTTVFAGLIKKPAPAGNWLTSVTNEVHAYTLKSKDENQLNLRIFDIRGFEDEKGYDKELTLLLAGKLPIGYQYHDEPSAEVKAISSEGLRDEIHLVCYVTGTPNPENVTHEHTIRIQTIQETVNKKGLPMIVVATKFDLLCEEIYEDADHVYQCPKAGDAIKKISGCFGIEKSYIFPIVNYVDDQNVNCGKDRLALQALAFMVRLIEDNLGTNKALDYRPKDRFERATKLHNSETKKEIEDLLLNVKTALEDNQLRVLCTGAVNSGKTSFIDSIASTLEVEMSSVASGGCTMTSKLPNGNLVCMTEKMIPMKYKTVEAKNIKTSKVYLGDIPGFQTSGGIQLKDVQYIIRGHVPIRHNMTKGINRNSQKFVKNPKKTEKVHCVCFVFDMSTSPSTLPENVRKTLQLLLRWLGNRRVPFLAILTKCDLCDEDEVMRDRMNQLMETFGFRRSKLFRVINYINEDKVVPEADALLMEAFSEILRLGKEYLDKSDDEDTDESDEGQVSGALP